MSWILRDLRALTLILEEEHAAMRRGDTARIGRLTPRAQKVLERLEGAGDLPPEAQPLAAQLKQRAQRNRKLIAAALEGTRAAQALVARARLPRRHETYARDGLRLQIGTVPGQLEKRS